MMGNIMLQRCMIFALQKWVILCYKDGQYYFARIFSSPLKSVNIAVSD